MLAWSSLLALILKLWGPSVLHFGSFRVHFVSFGVSKAPFCEFGGPFWELWGFMEWHFGGFGVPLGDYWWSSAPTSHVFSILVPFWGPCLVHFGTRNGQTIHPFFWSIFWMILEPFWMILGVHFGDFWDDFLWKSRTGENSKNRTACRREHQNQWFWWFKMDRFFMKIRVENVMEIWIEKTCQKDAKLCPKWD